MALTHVVDLLSAYLDNELDADTASRVKAHLATCPDCQSEERLLKTSWDLLGSLEAIEPSPNFRTRFWEKVREEEEKTFWRIFALPRLVPAVVGFVGVWIMGVMGGVLLFSSRTTSGGMNSAVSVFTAPYPPNSIEQAILAKR